MLRTRPIASSAFLLLAACSSGGKGDTADGGDSLTDLAGCTEDGGAFIDGTADLTEIPTVVEVNWDGDADGKGFVVYSEEGGPAQITHIEPKSASAHRILVRGLHATSQVTLRLGVHRGGDVLCSAPIEIDTGPLPTSLPRFTYAAGPQAEGSPEGWIFAPLITVDGTYVAILDASGEVVWAWLSEDAVWRVRPTRDGDGLLFNIPTNQILDEGKIYRISFDGEVEEIFSYLGSHSDFDELPDGTISSLGLETRPFNYEGKPVEFLGDTIVEKSPDGTYTELWHAFDEYIPDLTGTWPAANDAYPDVLDWTHVNYLTYDEDLQRYQISISGLNGVAEIDRLTGEIGFTVSLAADDIKFGGQGGFIHQPHSMHRMQDDDHYLIFNRNDYAEHACSDVSWMTIDRDAHIATETATYETDDCLSVYYLGQAMPIDDETIQVVWTTSGRIEQLTWDGQQRFSLQADLGAGVGFTTFATSLYP